MAKYRKIKKSRTLAPALILIGSLSPLGCRGGLRHESEPKTSGGGTYSPAFAELKPGIFNVIKPGGDTVCARGDEYAYFVLPGDPSRIILDFEGGGACWSDKTCSLVKPIFKDKVVVPIGASDPTRASGFYDHAHAGHPMKDWTHIYVPYCTGDIHWGDSVRTYGTGDESVTIRHKGAVNVRAVLEWMFGQIKDPKKIFVTGCSAGGYGSIFWAPEVKRHYPAASVYQFADSASGVITESFFQESFPSWNVKANFPSFVGSYEKVSSLPALYTMIAAHFPDSIYSQYNTRLDEDQIFYYMAMNGKDEHAWSRAMKSSIAQIEASSPNFVAFLPDGSQHCVLPYDNFYTMEAGGVRISSWLSDLVNDRKVQSAYCPLCKP